MKSFRYARIPLEVLRDERLSDRAKLLYAEIASNVYQGSVARIGVRLLAERAGYGKNIIQRVLDELIATGHIEKRGKEKSRMFYILTSDVFSQKARAGVRDVVYKPDGSSRYASFRKDVA